MDLLENDGLVEEDELLSESSNPIHPHTKHKPQHQKNPKRREKHESTSSSSSRFSSIVKLFVKKAPWSYTTPWRKEGQTSCTGTGFILPTPHSLNSRYKGIIVTNAHVVHRHVNVLVRAPSKNGSPLKFVARVIYLSVPFDLALLSVEDPLFWSNKDPLTLSSHLPELDDDVTCVGFPVGGDNISVTRGVVSRIDVGREHVLRIQIDAAINPGNSGGPVFDSRGCVAGVASSHLKDASNIGYIIPSEVLHLFIDSFSGRDSGLPFPGIANLWVPNVQLLESPVLRSYLGISQLHEGGVRISSVEQLGPCNGLLCIDDVLLSINGEFIGRDGTVPLRPNRDQERIPFWYLITREAVGGVVTLSFLRGGSDLVQSVQVTLQAPKYLVPRHDGWDCSPSYFICGGLVFVPLSKPWSKNSKRKVSSLTSTFPRMVKEEGEQVIVLSQVLAHSVNFGYHNGNIDRKVLKSFNGEPVNNLSQLAQLVNDCGKCFYEFELLRQARDMEEDSSSSNLCSVIRVVLDKKACSESESEILGQHMIEKAFFNIE